jgi:hypothetical protein
MSNKSKKIEISENSSLESKKDEIKKINLDAFKDQLSKMDIPSSSKGRIREHLYIYPEGWNQDIINGLQGKKFRNQKRSQIQRFANNIFYYGKTDKLDELQKEINAFKDFYKSFYRINDYSISSLSNSNDEKKNANIEFMLSIIKSTL